MLQKRIYPLITITMMKVAHNLHSKITHVSYITIMYNYILLLSWPENQGILFFYISKTLEMIWISFMASLLNAVL